MVLEPIKHVLRVFRTASKTFHKKCPYGHKTIMVPIDHFTAVCLVTWPLNESEAGVDLALIETSQLFLCKFLLISIMMRTTSLT